MPRPKSPTLTDGELRLMRVLWDRGGSSVGDIVEALPRRRRPAYNTVLTMMRILETKGYATHTKVGRAFVFSPLVDRRHAQRHALTALLNRFFEGSPRLLALNLIEEEQLAESTLAELKQRVGGDSHD